MMELERYLAETGAGTPDQFVAGSTAALEEFLAELVENRDQIESDP